MPNKDSGTALSTAEYRRTLNLMFAGVSLFVIVFITVVICFPAVPRASTEISRAHTSSEMQQVIAKYSEDIASVADSPETMELMTQAALMIALWSVPVGDYLTDAGAIVGFSFGQGKMRNGKPTPGGSNTALAWSIAQLINEYEENGLPRPKVMVQWEIADVLLSVHGITADEIASVDAEGNYLSTYGVMEQLQVPLQEQQISTVALVAHPDHAVRCGKVIQRFNVSALGTGYLAKSIPWEQFGCDEHGYSPDSVQPWTRARAKYLIEEIWLRPRYVERGQLSFANDHFRASDD